MYQRKIKYTSVSISEPLMQQIQEHIKTRKNYISAGDFLRAAAREKMDRDKHPFISNDPQVNKIMSDFATTLGRIEQKLKKEKKK